MKEFNLEIVTPSKLAYKASVLSATIPGTVGEFQILFNHAPFLSSFEVGKIKVLVSENNEISFATTGGTVEVLNNTVQILADTLEKSNEIDADRAKRSAERAKNRLSQSDKSNVDVLRAEASLLRALNRLKVAGVK
jgi:F-type H+-transporting ATPase subunit epsilon